MQIQKKLKMPSSNSQIKDKGNEFISSDYKCQKIQRPIQDFNLQFNNYNFNQLHKIISQSQILTSDQSFLNPKLVWFQQFFLCTILRLLSMQGNRLEVQNIYYVNQNQELSNDFVQYPMDIPQVIETQNQVEWEKWNFNVQQPKRFSYLIWGSHQVLQNVTCFKTLFSEIKSKSKINQAFLSYEPKLPSKMQGAIIELRDSQDMNLYQALLILAQKFVQIQKKLREDWNQVYSLMVAIPRTLIPVIMGKEGKLLNRIKKISDCSITVYGPYQKYNYQNVQITSTSIENVCQACFMMYNSAYKILKCQSVTLQKEWLKGSLQCKFGILISQQIYQKIFYQYETYINSLRKETQASFQFINYNRSKLKQKEEKIVMISGKMDKVKIFINHLLRLMWYENCLEEDFFIILTNYLAKAITNFSGKILRDMSSKSEYIYMDIKQKDMKFNRVLLRGNLEGRIKVLCLILQFICFKNQIIEQENEKKRINYISELEIEKKKIDPNWIKLEDVSENLSDCSSKTKRIKKFEKITIRSNYKKRGKYHKVKRAAQLKGSKKKCSPTKRKIKLGQRFQAFEISNEEIQDHIVAGLLTENMQHQ